MALSPKQKQIMAKHLKGGAGGNDDGDDDDGDDDLEELRNPDPPTVSDDDDDDDAPAAAKADDEDLPEVVNAEGEPVVTPKLSWKDKKRNRFREAQEAAAMATAAAQRQEQINERLTRLLERRNEPEKEPEKDPLAIELERVQTDMDLLTARVDAKAGKMTAAEEAEFMKQARELRAKEARLHGRIAYREEAANSGPRVDEAQILMKARVEAQVSALEADFPEAYEYKRRGPDGQVVFPALQYAKHQWNMKMAKAGLDPAQHAMSPQAAKFRREALKDATREFGLGGTREVSAGQKRKYGGVPSGGGGGGSKAPIRMSAADEKMMNARWKHIKDPKERAKQWAKHVGAKRVAAK